MTLLTLRKPGLDARVLWLAPASAVLLMAADPSWRSEAIQAWTQEDARQVLTESPWAKTTSANVYHLQTEDQRREGGNMGEEHGIGYDGLDKDRMKLPKNILGILFSSPPPRPIPQIPMQVVWLSALPIRVAELKAGVIDPHSDPSSSPGDGYRIAVYGIPTANVKGDPKALGQPLKEQAFLRRDGRQPVKPLSCEVFQREDGMVAVYLFPLSAEISAKDGLVEFDARIGRIGLVQFFNAMDMEFQGKLEL